MNKRKHYTMDTFLMIILVILSAVMIYTIFNVAGPSWDITARYLNGKTLFDYIMQLKSASPLPANLVFSGEALNNLRYYFEPYREPLSTPIFAGLDIFFSNSILPYMILSLVVYIFAVLALGRELGVDKLIMLAAFVNPYAIYFFFMLNGGEGLAVVFVFIGIIYLLRKNPISGLFFGIAVLAKYPALIFLPIVILLWDWKKTITAGILAIAPIVLWGIIDGIVWGTPFSSYLLSIQYSNVTTATFGINIFAVLAVIIYPIIFIAIGLQYFKKRHFNIWSNYRNRVLTILVVLSALGYIAILPHNDPFTQARYGFLLGAILMIIAAIVINTAALKRKNLKYIAVAISVLSMIIPIIGFVYINFNNNTHLGGVLLGNQTVGQLEYFNPENPSSIFIKANTELKSLGFSNCRIISNAWIFMLYSGQDTYSPYAIYPDNQQAEYPVVIFNLVGVPVQQTPIYNKLDNMEYQYNYTDMTIYIPHNAQCYPYNET